jgi:hypothetical protein
MSTVTSLLAISLLVPLTTLPAQQSPPIERGSRIRVTAPSMGADKLVGTCMATGGDTLYVQAETQTTTLGIAVTSVTRLETSRGRKSHPWRGAGIGALSGAVLGLGIAVAFPEGEDREELLFFPVTGIGAGLVVGAYIGALIKTDRWEEVPLDQLRVSFVPQRDGRLGLALSISF